MDSSDLCFGFNNQSEQRVSILSLDSFTPAFVDPNCTKEETSRRFLTFFLENKAPYPSCMVLRKAYNTLNECVALKSPLFHEDGIKEMEYKETSQEALQRYEEVQTLLTLEEFRNSLTVSHLKGFPRMFGLGNAKGKPIIVREYVEGGHAGSSNRLTSPCRPWCVHWDRAHYGCRNRQSGPENTPQCTIA